MKIDVVTIFPQIFDGFLGQSLLARAIKKKLLSIKAHDLRKWTNDSHKTVDGRPYGGGAGMVMKIEPIYRAIKALLLKSKKKPRVILLSAKGKTFNQNDARRLSKHEHLIFICGRYEGVDERVAKYVADEEISIGNFILFGGEVATMCIIESVARLIPGIVAKEESIINESFSDRGASIKEHPQYTRPEEFKPNKKGKSWKVPKILLSGDHKKIKDWRSGH